MKKMKHIMKIFAAALTALIMTVFAAGCEKPAAEPVYPPFFYAADEETGGEVYMLGTMHVGTAAAVYPDEIYSALDACGTLVCELDLIALDKDKAQVAEAMKLLECKTGKASDYMGGDYAEIRDFFRKKGLYNAAYDKYIPSVWSSVLSNEIAERCGLYSEYGTDRVLLEYARKKGYRIVELETCAEQYAINAAESPALQVYTLKDASENYDSQLEIMKELYGFWSEGNTEGLAGMLANDDVPAELSADYEDFYRMMYVERQEKMADHAINALKNGGKIFLAAGAMHFCAEKDILDFLEESGYEAKQLTATAVDNDDSLQLTVDS